MTLSIIIATRNRAEDLERTCGRLAALRPAPDAFLFALDATSDDSEERIRQLLPTAIVRRNAKPQGSVASRDALIRSASTDLVFLLDDDSYPEDSGCLRQIETFFQEHPDVAVLHFPQHTDEYAETLEVHTVGPERETRSFANSGAVLRRDIYLRLAGFEPAFFHMYEEPDYALQCVGAGLRVVFSPGLFIRHHFTRVARNELRNHHFHSRNEFWSTLLRCPLPLLPLMLPWRMASQARYAFSRGAAWVVREPLWWFRALARVPYCLAKRRPVSLAAYKRWLSLP